MKIRNYNAKTGGDAIERYLQSAKGFFLLGEYLAFRTISGIFSGRWLAVPSWRQDSGIRPVNRPKGKLPASGHGYGGYFGLWTKTGDLI